MLISHKYKFIFFKSIKTASSSVFEFFTPYCLPDEENFKHENYLDLSHIGFYKTGIVGDPNSNSKYNKMHVRCQRVKKVLDEINKKIWRKYFKFSVVRNPWDLCVSRYFWHKANNKPYNFEQMIKMLSTGLIPARKDLYQMNDNYICDYYIKYENLLDDIKTVCEKCNIKKYDLNNLTNQKSNYRDHSISYREYYNSELKDIVARVYADDIKKFNYSF